MSERTTDAVERKHFGDTELGFHIGLGLLVFLILVGVSLLVHELRQIKLPSASVPSTNAEAPSK